MYTKNLKNQVAQAKTISQKYEILNICYKRKEILEQLRIDFKNLHNSHISELKNIKSNIDNYGKKIDLISVIVRGFANVGYTIGRAIKANGETLLKLNEELVSKTLEMAYDPLATIVKDELISKYSDQGIFIKFAFAFIENRKNIFGFIGDLFDLTNPSFYAKLYLKIFKKVDPDKDIDEFLRNAENQKIKSLRNIDEKIHEINFIIDQLQNELRGTTDLFNPKRLYA